MAGFVVGTMSSQAGWITKSVEEALDYHFMYYFTSRRSQGKIIPDTPSFYYLHSQYSDNQERLVSTLTESFKEYLVELFPKCDVNVTTRDISPNGSTYTLVITARVVHSGTAYDLAKSILINGESYKVLDESRFSQ